MPGKSLVMPCRIHAAHGRASRRIAFSVFGMEKPHHLRVQVKMHLCANGEGNGAISANVNDFILVQVDVEHGVRAVHIGCVNIPRKPPSGLISAASGRKPSNNLAVSIKRFGRAAPCYWSGITSALRRADGSVLPSCCPVIRFMPGLPMKRATNRLAGS